MTTRTSFLAMLLLIFLVSTTQGAVVSFQDGFGGYGDTQIIGFNGNDEPLPSHTPYIHGWSYGGLGYMDGLATVSGDGFRNHIQLIRFDEIFGDGPGQIPEDAGGIANATLTVTQAFTSTATFDAYRALLPWTEADLAINYDTDPGNRPRGPDRFSPDDGELSPTFITSAAAVPRDTVLNTGGEIVFDVTSDLRYFLDNPSERFGWGLVKSGTGSGIAFYSHPDRAGVPANTGPLLVVEWVPEPSTFLLSALGLLSLSFIRRRRRPY